MEGIGQGAGASKTLGYAYFDNVDHVIVALHERELGRLNVRVKEAAAEVVGPPGVVAQMRAMISSATQYATRSG